MKKFFIALGCGLGFYVIYLVIIQILNLSFESYFMIDINNRMQSMVESGIPVNSSYVQINLENDMLYIGNYLSIATATLTLIIIAIIFKIRKKHFFKETSIKPVKLKTLPISVVNVIADFYLVASLTAVIFINFPQLSSVLRNNQEHLAYTSNSLPLAFASIVIMAPIIEEIMCRGLFLSRFRKGMPIVLAVIIQGLLFALMHGEITHILQVLPFGIITGVLAVKYNSITLGIFMHFTYNLLFSIAPNFLGMIPQDMTYIYYIVLAISLVLFVLSLIVMLKIRPSKYERFTDIKCLSRLKKANQDINKI